MVLDTRKPIDLEQGWATIQVRSVGVQLRNQSVSAVSRSGGDMRRLHE